MEVEENQEFTDEDVLASLEEKPEGEPEITDPSAEGFRFKSLDELMGHSLKYNASGKDVEEPIGTILKRASQGYHYAQRMGELNTKESEWTKKVQEAEQLAARYREIDEYARQNPDWFDHWNNAYQNRSVPVGGDGSPVSTQFDPNQIASLIDQKLAPFQETIQQQQQRAEQERVAKQNAELDAAIEKTRKEFSDVDFTATDPETGMSLEHKVYQFMVDNGINDFNRAYKLMDYDNIILRQTERAKAELVKQEQMKRKQGIVGETSGTARGNKPVDTRGLTHDQEQALMLQELERLKQQGG